MGRFYDSLNDTIGNLQSFDENLKLKLTLNLELIQQDQKCWEKHLEEKKLASPDKTVVNEEESNNLGLQDQIRQMHKILKAQQSDMMTSTKASGFFKKQQVQARSDIKTVKKHHSEVTENMAQIMDSIRSIMQKSSITWSIFKNEPIPEKKLHEKFLCNKIISLTALYMSWSLNDMMQNTEYLIENQSKIVKQKLEIQKTLYDAKMEDKEQEIVSICKLHEKDIEEMQYKIDQAKKENERLEEALMEKDAEIKDLLSGGEDYRRIKNLMDDLDSNLKVAEAQADQNE